MVQSHTISAIFLILVSANMIQGGILLPHLFNADTFSNFVNLANIPGMGEFSNNFVSSAAATASNTFHGFKTGVDNFRTGLGQYLVIPPKYPALHRFVHGEIWPNFAGPAAEIVPSQLATPGFSGGLVGNSGPSIATATAETVGGLAKR